MTHATRISLTVCFFAALAAGCADGDSDDPGTNPGAGATDGSNTGAICQSYCNRADECDNVTALPNCVQECEASRTGASDVGPACPDAVDDGLACLTTASCEDFGLSASTGRTEECVYEAYQTRICDIVDSLEDPIITACDATCTQAEVCPQLEAEEGCRRICIENFNVYDGTSEDCEAAALALFECLAGLSCENLDNLINGRVHGCEAADQAILTACGDFVAASIVPIVTN